MPGSDLEGTTVFLSRKLHILVVDDDACVRETLAMVLITAGYATSTARDGLDALAQFKTNPPDILLCDLEIPRMSAVALLAVVRRRFPKIAVVAMSGMCEKEAVPDDVLADAFYAKGRSHPERLFNILADVICASPTKRNNRIAASAPVWARQVGKDASGTPCVVVSCTECLRSFLSPGEGEAGLEVKEMECAFCLSPIRLVRASSLAPENPRNNAASIRNPAGLDASETQVRAAAKGR